MTGINTTNKIRNPNDNQIPTILDLASFFEVCVFAVFISKNMREQKNCI